MIRLVFLLIILSGCSVYPGLKKRTFSFTMDKSDVVLFVPARYKAAQVRIGLKGGIEQFYRYNHGAYVYVSHQAEWNSSNDRFIAQDTIQRIEANGGFIYSGRDESGLYWKEVRVDSLKWGYSFVPVNLLPQFEQFANTVRVKDRGTPKSLKD